MDWERYKNLCDSPQVFSRWMIEQSVELLRARQIDCDVLVSALNGSALDKPADHRGGRATDMFELALSAGDAEVFVAAIAAAVAEGAQTSGTRDRGLGGFLEAWQEYARSLGETSGTR